MERREVIQTSSSDALVGYDMQLLGVRSYKLEPLTVGARIKFN